METKIARMNPTLWSAHDRAAITLWIERAKVGDQEAQRQIYEAAYEHLLARTRELLCYMKLDNRYQASELLNEELYTNLMTAVRNTPINNREHLANIAINHIKFMLLRLKERATRQVQPSEGENGGDGFGDQPGDASGPDAVTVQLDLLEAMQSLDEPLRRAFDMFYAGLGYADIAEELGESKSN